MKYKKGDRFICVEPYGQMSRGQICDLIAIPSKESNDRNLCDIRGRGNYDVDTMFISRLGTEFTYIKKPTVII